MFFPGWTVDEDVEVVGNFFQTGQDKSHQPDVHSTRGDKSEGEVSGLH